MSTVLWWYFCIRDERRVYRLRGNEVVPGTGATGWWHSIRTASWYLGNRLRLCRAADQSTTVARRIRRRPTLSHQSNAWYHCSLFFRSIASRLAGRLLFTQWRQEGDEGGGMRLEQHFPGGGVSRKIKNSACVRSFKCFTAIDIRPP